ncbi:MAG TPA: short-chain dehydrogenase [Alphaproteobacteria bacterium]|nr:short-chain dehydrogenase [Alphaproteobacteria bacterium]HAJ45086.1 short-chain dehydrogenase [Alphaproteobacteria bacterium]
MKRLSFDLNGRRALVTGATSGLGERFAHVLVAHGAEVIVTGRREDRLRNLVETITRGGGVAIAQRLDVTEASSLHACVSASGPVDVLVNNAGLNVQARADDLSEADYDLIMNTNVKGAFLMAQAIGRTMIARGQGGRIINVASIGAFKALPGLTAYSMSKAAVAMMTQGLAREWARHDINVNALCPGFILTELNQAWFQTEGGRKQVQGFPRRRLGTPEDLDGLLLFLASSHSRFVTGSLFTADDGQLLA